MTAAEGVPAASPATRMEVGGLPARLTLVPGLHRGGLGGVWWPRTRCLALELHELAAGLEARGVVTTRLSLSVTAWDSTPGRLRLEDRDVRLAWVAYQAHDTVTVGHLSGEITLLVVPPEATEESASRAVFSALNSHSAAQPEDILAASTAAFARRT
jgi:hypothetical protein